MVTWSRGAASTKSTMFARLTSSNLSNTLNITCTSTISSVYLRKVNVIAYLMRIDFYSLIYLKITVKAKLDKTLESVIGEALLSGVGGLLMLNSNLIKTVSLFLMIINYPL